MLMDAHVGEGGVKNGRKCAEVINVRPQMSVITPNNFQKKNICFILKSKLCDFCNIYM